MNYRNFTTVAALTAALALGTIAKADPIVGGIVFGNKGEPGVSLTPVGTNEYDLSFLNAQVTGDLGTFAGIPDDTVAADLDLTFATILLTGVNPTFTGASLTGPTDNGGDLWTFVYLGTTYSFVPTSFDVTPDHQLNPGWLISGTGIFSATGLDDTPGTYSLDFSANGITGFASTNFANVPDSGTTALLLALGMLAMGAYAFRSKLSKA